MQLARARSVVPGIRFVPLIDSTNAELTRGHLELPDFSVLLAAEQTSGRGRSGRSWVSMPNSSLSVSFLLRPNWPFLHSFATLLAAASTHRALTHLFSGIDVSIKWPNDIMIGQLKVAGILAQRNLDGSVVVGIGINLFPQSQAPETATALSEYVQPDFDEVTAALLASMRSNWLSLQENADTDQLIDYIRSNCSTLGMRVRAELANSESIVGRAINITAQGHLVIHNETEHVVAAADLWHLRKH